MLPDGLTKVADFGIARVDATDLTRTGSQLGTPSYMSPEQFTGAAVDNRSDLYAAAAVLHEMVSGEKAFTGTSITEVMYAVLEKHPTDLRELKGDIPPDLADVVRKALAKRPDERYQTAAEFAEAFESAFAEPTITMARRRGVNRFAATSTLTDALLPSLNVGMSGYLSDLKLLIRRRAKTSLDEAACDLLEESACKTLGYDDLVKLVQRLAKDSDRRAIVYTLASELSARQVEPSEIARFDAFVKRLARLSTNKEEVH